VTRGAIAALSVSCVALAACGSSSNNSSSATTAAPTTTAAPSTSAAASSTSAAATTATTAAQPSSSAAAGPDQRAFKIMTINDYTNTYGMMLDPIKAAVAGVFKDHPNVQIINCDSKADPNQANNCETQAVKDGVAAVVTAVAGLGAADFSILKDAKIPMVGLVDSTAANGFATVGSTAGSINVGYGAAQAGCKNVGILNLEGRDELTTAIGVGVQKGGAKVAATATVPLNSPDMSAPVAKLTGAKSDCIVVSLPGTMTVQAWTAISQSGANVKIIGLGDLLVPALRQALGKMMDNTLIVETSINPDDPNATVINKILSDMQSEVPSMKKSNIDLFAINSWAAAEIVKAAAAKVTGDVTPASLTPALDALRNVDLQDAIHEFSAVPISSSKDYPRFFNHYGRVYQGHADGSISKVTDWYDFSSALP
jgi:ABC-type branched-subunit amino acid transport system substrate-binding protein